MEQQLLRKRDLIVLVIVILSLYFTFDTPKYQYNFSPSWYFTDKNKGNNLNGYNVKPLITDIDGDGSNDIILISKDLYLRILSTNSNKNIKSDIHTPKVIASTKLNKVKISKGKNPIALSSGFVSRYDNTSARKQIIVVITEDFTVTCFDSALNLLWEKAIAHNSLDIDSFIDEYNIHEVSILVSPLSIRNNSNIGTIFVGLSLHPKSHNVSIENGLLESEDGILEHKDINFRTKVDHFNIYALDSENGHIIWRHNGMDVNTEQYEKSLPQHAYTLDIQKLMMKSSQNLHHKGIYDWTIFKDSLLAELPHEWHTREDTFLKVSHFSRKSNTVNKNRKLSKSRSGKYDSKPFSRFTGIESKSLPNSVKFAHDVSEHISNPNVLVAHTSKGLEIISLVTGMPITALALQEEKTYTDIDGDNVVDTLIVLEHFNDISIHGKAFELPGSNLKHCSLLALSGLPPLHQLFNSSICPQHGNINDPIAQRNANKFNRDSLPLKIEAASPVIVNRIDSKTLQESKLKNIVISINSGIITCISGHGNLKWQLRDGPKWNIGFKYKSSSLFDSDAYRVKEKGSHSSIGANIFIVGENSFHLISNDGEILAITDIPDKPISKPIFGDFDSDGITDVIIVTEECFYGYKLEITESSKGLLLSFLILTIIAVIVFVVNIRSTYNELESNNSLNSNKKKVLTLFRSTDNFHTD